MERALTLDPARGEAPRLIRRAERAVERAVERERPARIPAT